LSRGANENVNVSSINTNKICICTIILVIFVKIDRGKRPNFFIALLWMVEYSNKLNYKMSLVTKLYNKNLKKKSSSQTCINSCRMINIET
jgi:hypothetical protein